MLAVGTRDVLCLLETLEDKVDDMATLQDVKDAIAAETAEVTAAVDDLMAQIKTLQDQITNGGVATAADLDDITASVKNIFTRQPTGPTGAVPTVKASRPVNL
jgi:hypothetical protein